MLWLITFCWNHADNCHVISWDNHRECLEHWAKVKHLYPAEYHPKTTTRAFISIIIVIIQEGSHVKRGSTSCGRSPDIPVPITCCIRWSHDRSWPIIIEQVTDAVWDSQGYVPPNLFSSSSISRTSLYVSDCGWTSPDLYNNQTTAWVLVIYVRKCQQCKFRATYFVNSISKNSYPNLISRKCH